MGLHRVLLFSSGPWAPRELHLEGPIALKFEARKDLNTFSQHHSTYLHRIFNSSNDIVSFFYCLALHDRPWLLQNPIVEAAYN